jgi:hypothetical protein
MSVVALLYLVVIGTSIWVAVDASSIGARSGLVKGFAGMGPAGWFFCCLLLWIVGFPLYLAKRSEIRAAAVASRVAAGSGSQLPNNPIAPSRSPNSIVEGQQVYWEGTASSVASKADELTKLDALRQSGVLSQEEFDAEKAKLLAAPSQPPVHPA